MSRYLTITGLLLFCLLIVLLIFPMADLRLQELQGSFFHNGSISKDNQSAALIGRYLQIKKNLQSKTENLNDYIKEAEMFLVSVQEQKTTFKLEMGLLDQAALKVINFVNWLSGEPAFSGRYPEMHEAGLETAYAHEARRRFYSAVKIYESLPEMFNYSFRERSYISLHSGFCLSLIGKTDEAIKQYETTIADDFNTDFSYTARVLLSYLLQIREFRERYRKLPDSTEKGIMLYRSMAYSEAIDILKNTDKKTAESVFYHGRSLEESGKSEPAIEKYQQVINKFPKTEWALFSNRRIYMISRLYAPEEPVAQKAKKFAEKTKDKAFFRKIDRLANALEGSNEKLFADKDFKQLYLQSNTNKLALNDAPAATKSEPTVNEKKKSAKTGALPPATKKKSVKTTRPSTSTTKIPAKSTTRSNTTTTTPASGETKKRPWTTMPSTTTTKTPERTTTQPSTTTTTTPVTITETETKEVKETIKEETKEERKETTSATKEDKKETIETNREQPEKEKKPSREESIEHLTTTKLSPDEKFKYISKSFKKAEKFYTNQGTVIVGIIAKEGGDHFEVITLFGKIKLPKADITAREAVDVNQMRGF